VVNRISKRDRAINTRVKLVQSIIDFYVSGSYDCRLDVAIYFHCDAKMDCKISFYPQFLYTIYIGTKDITLISRLSKEIFFMVLPVNLPPT
jgi:hypothetical protein